MTVSRKDLHTIVSTIHIELNVNASHLRSRLDEGNPWFYFLVRFNWRTSPPIYVGVACDWIQSKLSNHKTWTLFKLQDKWHMLIKFMVLEYNSTYSVTLSKIRGADEDIQYPSLLEVLIIT